MLEAAKILADDLMAGTVVETAGELPTSIQSRFASGGPAATTGSKR